MMTQFEAIKHHHLNETECKILDVILTEIKQSNDKIGIREIANKNFVSTTTVFKLAKKLGYNGYSDMLFSLKQSLLENQSKSTLFNFEVLLDNYSEDIINDFLNYLNIFKKDRIYVIGLGFSAIATTYIVKKLSTLNFLTYEGSPTDMILNENKPTLTIAVSKSAETDDILNLVKRAKKSNHKIVLFTMNKKGRLNKYSDIEFCLKNENTNQLIDIPDYFVGKTILLFEYFLSLYIKRGFIK